MTQQNQRKSGGCREDQNNMKIMNLLEEGECGIDVHLCGTQTRLWYIQYLTLLQLMTHLYD